jgi:hypothetical protein
LAIAALIDFGGSGFPIGIARHGQCQQSVADHGIWLAEHFGQLLAVWNTDAPGNAETVIDRQAGEVADEQAGTAEIHVVRQFTQCGDQFGIGNGQHAIHQSDGSGRLFRRRRWSKESQVISHGGFFLLLWLSWHATCSVGRGPLRWATVLNDVGIGNERVALARRVG